MFDPSAISESFSRFIDRIRIWPRRTAGPGSLTPAEDFDRQVRAITAILNVELPRLARIPSRHGQRAHHAHGRLRITRVHDCHLTHSQAIQLVRNLVSLKFGEETLERHAPQ